MCRTEPEPAWKTFEKVKKESHPQSPPARRRALTTTPFRRTRHRGHRCCPVCSSPALRGRLPAGIKSDMRGSRARRACPNSTVFARAARARAIFFWRCIHARTKAAARLQDRSGKPSWTLARARSARERIFFEHVPHLISPDHCSLLHVGEPKNRVCPRWKLRQLDQNAPRGGGRTSTFWDF